MEQSIYFWNCFFACRLPDVYFMSKELDFFVYIYKSRCKNLRIIALLKGVLLNFKRFFFLDIQLIHLIQNRNSPANKICFRFSYIKKPRHTRTLIGTFALQIAAFAIDGDKKWLVLPINSWCVASPQFNLLLLVRLWTRHIDVLNDRYVRTLKEQFGFGFVFIWCVPFNDCIPRIVGWIYADVSYICIV